MTTERITGTATWPGWCPHCGRNVAHFGPCPNIAAIEYYPNGTIKRIEYRASASSSVGGVYVKVTEPTGAVLDKGEPR